jgi:hypothetical protein
MDMTHPIRAVLPTLDGPVLEVLARTTRLLSGREVHRLAGIGSAAGVRLALMRLTEQGVVHVEERSSAVYYRANRDHLAWPAVEMLAHLRRMLIDRLRERLRSWPLQPVHASLFGSAARGDGSTGSDIDLLSIRPDGVDEDDSPWAEQIDHLRHEVQAWTGNSCQVFQIDLPRLGEHVRAGDPLVDEWRRDAITVAGEELRVVLRRVPGRGQQ